VARHDANDAYTKAMGNLTQLSTTLSEVANRQAEMVGRLGKMEESSRALDDRVAGQAQRYEVLREGIHRLDRVLVQHAEAIQRMGGDLGRLFASLEDLGRRVAELGNKEAIAADAGRALSVPSDPAAALETAATALGRSAPYEDRSYAPGTAAQPPATMTSPNTSAP
jgi:predicted nuclease with TOPRIM domain